MMHSSNRLRVWAAVGVAAILLVAACGGSSSSTASNNGNGGNGGNPTGGGSSLGGGLQSHLDELDSYQFSENLAAGAAGSGASPSGTALLIKGTVVNKGTKAVWIDDLGVQFIAIGENTWTSLDGETWYAADPKNTSLTSLLPGQNYLTWFDAKARNFKIVGEESKNGVQCVHYKGDDSLGTTSGITGVTAEFHADVWIAKSGSYPVSGVYGFTASSGTDSGGFGYSFDVTHINDATNKVTAPTNVVAQPS